MRPLFLSIGSCVALLFVLGSPSVAVAQQTQRFALILGSNEGGKGRDTLRYALKDADAMASVLRELGGVSASRIRQLKDPTVEGLRGEMARMKGRIGRSEAARKELIVYYSGHSDESGLRLFEGVYPYRELKKNLREMGADVHVVILDSCASGHLTRKKGGRKVPPFLHDQGTVVRGHAFLTSSSESEAAQESDRLKGSFFTHYLVSGLKGAADTTGDRQVSLNEVYQFAFQETRARTVNTLGGVQHPAYDIELSGHGDLVLTDYSAGAALIQVDRALAGHLLIQNTRTQAIVELTKVAGRPVELGLEPGVYRVRLELGQERKTAEIKLFQGRSVRLDRTMFAQAPEALLATRKGQTVSPIPASQVIPLGIDVLPYVGVSSGWPDATRRLSLNVLGGRSGGILGLEMGGGLNLTGGSVRGLQMVGGVNLVDHDLRGVQMAGLMNLVQGRAQGLQVAGGLNYAAKGVRGLQSALINAQGGALQGLQLAGVNLSFGSQPDRGAQIGALNIQTGPTEGLLQMGGVNVATTHVDGLMFGALNIAPSATASLGAVNVFWEGESAVQTWADSAALLQTGFKHGSGLTYNIYHVGLQPLASDESELPQFQAGIKTGIQRDLAENWRAYGDLGYALGWSRWSDFKDQHATAELRTGGTYALWPWLGVTGGVGAQLRIEEGRRFSLPSWVPAGRFSEEGDATQVFLLPMAYVGVEVF